MSEEGRAGGKKRGVDIRNGRVFVFKQKTAYEMLRSRVGAEMCIRDSSWEMRLMT